MKYLRQFVVVGSLFAVGSANADQVILDDLIVDGSACVGQDCVNGESFGFDTLRLKENNLRIKFQDTSASASFPSNDWQLTANDSSNGGANKFSIDDIDGGRTPFTIEASAPSHSLYVDDGGRIGLGKSTPVVELHIVDGDTPTVRLEQDGSSGFTPQTWDLAGNETNFFIRDVTNGSRLGFRIRPGAPESSIDIQASGDVGIGTSSASERLDVADSGNVRFALTATDGDQDSWVFNHNAGQNALIVNYVDGGTTSEFVLGQNGNLTISGELTTGGTTCGMGGCDTVFSPSYQVETIDEHAAQMWENSFLPSVGQTIENEPFNITKKTGGMLNELEKAHIYIEQLHKRLEVLEAAFTEAKLSSN
jgi:hypothetical protein